MKSLARRALSPRYVWITYLALGSLACASYLFVPPLRGSGPVINGLGFSGVVAVLAGLRMHKPRARMAWGCFVAGLLLFWLGDIYTYSYPKLTGADVPFPSLGDALYLLVYPALMTGLLVLVRRRNRRGDGVGVLDALIMSLGLALVSGLLLIAPYVHDKTLSLLPKLVSIGYPMGDIILLAGAIRLAVDRGKRRPAFYLLVASIVTLLSTDFVYGLMTLHGTYHHQLFLDAGWIFFYLLWGAAALHPSMRELEDAGHDTQPRLSLLRLALLGGASLIAPVLEVFKGFHLGDSDLISIAGASVVLTGLVVGRMAGLLRHRERSVARESALKDTASALVAATSSDEITLAALALVHDLVDGHAEARLCAVGEETVRVTAQNLHGGLDEWKAPASLVATLAERDSDGGVELPDRARDELHLGIGCEKALVLEIPVRGRPGLHLVVVGESAAAPDTQNALRTLASQVALALESSELSEEVHRQASEARFASLVQNSSDLITLLDAHTTVLYQSPSVERLLGYTPSELIGRAFEQLLHPSERGRLLWRLTDGTRGGRSEPEVIECTLRHRDGTPRQFEILCSNLLDDPAVRGIVLNARDVTERKKIESQLAEHAFHDPVTHLANRALFNERVRHAVARARRDGIGLAVVFLDLDDFKTVNDSLGHAAGDRLLLEVAQRITASIRAADTAARFGGDEFAILLEDMSDPQVAAATAQRICATLGRAILLDQQEVVVRASLGISLAAPGEPVTADDLIRNADAAMYIAKAEGKGGYRMFEPAMHRRVLERLELRTELERALERQEFELYYQPVVRLQDHRVTSVEALLRWRHPTRGIVMPGEFVPFAEETGLIVPLGRWVLREGCREARRLREELHAQPPPSVSVNLSVKQLFNSDIVADVAAAIADAGLDPAALTLEITESVMMTDTEFAVRRLTELRELGVKLAMDDFGTGYSSLSYLSRFPLDVLKMDRSLLSGASQVTSGLATAVLGLGETFALQVVAEGIELGEQSQTLHELGCELGQGFYFAEPMLADELIAYLESRSGAEPERPPLTGA